MTSGPKLLPGSLNWRPVALACAMAMVSLSTQALNLGKLSVTSGLNEPLRAELEITQFTIEDLRSLKVQLATPHAFEQAGMSFSPALVDLQVQLDVQHDGRPFIVFTGKNPARNHFIDLILETQWATGRLAMNYTVLLPDKSMVRSTEPPAADQAVDKDSNPIQLTALTTATTAVAAAVSDEEGSLTVQPGDTASKLARKYLTQDITLEQMLLAMVRSNPDAFIEGNVNWIRAGARLKMPNAQEAQQTPAEEARQTVIKQAINFGAYAQRLASAPIKAAPSAGREAAGLVQTDAGKALETSEQDKLTLTKGEVSPHSEEAQLALARESQAAAEQLAALNKNVQSLQALAPTSKPAPAAAIHQGETVTPAPVPAPAQMSLLDEISENPVALGGLVSLLAGLVGLLLWMRHRSRQSTDLCEEVVTPDKNTWSVDRDLKAQLAGLDLNLDTPSPVTEPAPSEPVSEVVATQFKKDTDQSKLILAVQLLQKGEIDLARSLIESVANNATGELRERARQLLGQSE